MEVMLPIFIASQVVGGILAWLASQKSLTLTRWISLSTIALNVIAAIMIWFQQPEAGGTTFKFTRPTGREIR